MFRLHSLHHSIDSCIQMKLEKLVENLRRTIFLTSSFSGHLLSTLAVRQSRWSCWIESKDQHVQIGVDSKKIER